MPTLKKRVPRLCHYKERDLAIVYVNGKVKYFGKYGSPEATKNYQEFVVQWAKRNLVAPKPPEVRPARPTTTVAAAFLQFWDWALKRYRHEDGTPTRAVDNFRTVFRILRRKFGALALADFGPSKLCELQEAFVEEGLARRTINGHVGKVRRFVRWCMSRELVDESVYRALCSVEAVAKGQGGRETLGRRRPVAMSDVETTLPHLSPMLQALVKVLLHTGARVSEIRTLTTRMIDRSDDVWKADLARHKTAHMGQSRLVLFGAKAIQAITPWLRPEEPDAIIFAPSRIRRGATNKKTKPEEADVYSRVSLPQALRRACKRAGVPNWSLAQLRHTRATMLREQYGLDVAATTLGHSKPNVTAQVYAREAIAHAIEAARRTG